LGAPVALGAPVPAEVVNGAVELELEPDGAVELEPGGAVELEPGGAVELELGGAVELELGGAVWATGAGGVIDATARAASPGAAVR
jgi:hypothetical protein